MLQVPRNLGNDITLLEQAQASITIYSPPCKCGQRQLLAGEEDVEGTWINELGIWISVHTLTSSLGRGSGWRERGGWSQHLDPALIPAPALFPRSCPDFPRLLRRLHLNLALCKSLKGAFVKMGGYFLFHSWLDWFIMFRYLFLRCLGLHLCSCALALLLREEPDHCLPSDQTASWYHL